MKTAPAYSEFAVRRVASGEPCVDLDDVLAIEEPLEIRLGFPKNGKIEHRAISITMRTPGDDEDLSAGFLFTEGILEHRSQIATIRRCGIPAKGKDLQNTVVVELTEGVDVDLERLTRNFYTTSSCGVCGKSSFEALHTGVRKLDISNIQVSSEVVHGLNATLLAAQATFEKTGGLHASVIFDLDGTVDTIAEDVGRHNALDKVIGRKFMSGETPMSNKILMVSGRASFELVQKALWAGIPILAAVGAPSSLAVELAREYGMTLIGFVRDERFNIYCGRHRIDAPITMVN
ncbi:MAG: formate dehydrogenase accessory sulfurtransferase FdhD [Acidobacteria bacterium]|nr:formate dehydrogenase accessory sulfurtransferase FdhD [Acidobacteriota bacterium]